MGSALRVVVGLAAALLVGGVGSAAAQSGAEDAINSRLDPQFKGRRGGTERPAGAAVDSPAPARLSEARATPAVRATPAEPGVSAAVPATPAVPAAAAKPIVPPGLSKDAPDTAPSVGVIGGNGKGKGSSGSTAATPEPSTLLLMGAGVMGLYRLRRRR